MSRRYFTLEEANALLADVAPRMERALQLHLWVRQGVEELRAGGHRISPRLLEDELEPSEDEDDPDPTLLRTRALYAAMNAEVAAIQALGAEVKGVARGLVDFWSWLDGEQEVLLCWQLGESRIEFYHPPESGFSGRAPVAGHEFTREPRSER